MNVTNKNIIRKLRMRFLSAGKTRNIIAIIAIALTSVMFTSVFTLGGSIINATQEHTMRQVGTSSHGGLKYLTMEQYEHFAQSPLIRDISYNRLLGLAENDELQKEQCEIRYSEDIMAEWSFSLPSTGRMPQSENEIACNTIVLNALNVPHEIGASVPLMFTVGGRTYSRNFTLSGFWEGDRVMVAQQIWLSREYVDSVLAENEIAEDDYYTGTISADVWFGNSFGITGKMIELIAERGFSADEILYGVNWAYATSNIEIDPTMVAMGVLILALILISGYLIIYSIFTISVNADIHFYGLLKTIGTTGKQLRRIVRGQAFVLSAFGIPVGLLLGYITGIYLSPFIMSIISVDSSTTATANPLIFAFAAVFSLLTVFIGCRKPGKIAASVSPVEAVGYSGVSNGSTKKARKTRQVTPLSMAWANVCREKRKLYMIVISLSLALILLNSAFSATQSFDMDAYLSRSISSDFAVADSSIFGVTNEKTNGVTADFLREAEARGTGEISNVYAHYYFDFRSEQDVTTSQIYGVGKYELETFSDIDYETLCSGNFAIVSRQVIAYGDNPVTVPEVGDILRLVDSNDNGTARDFEVIGLMDEYPHHLSQRIRYGNSLQIVLADDVFLEFFGETPPMQTNINVNAEDIENFEAWLAEYTTTVNPELSYISRNTLKDEFDGLQTTYLTMGGAMSLILALIGVLNFVNAVVASIIARRREFAMLQSVGMTGKQMRQTLFCEGAYYTVLTMLFTLTLGLGISWLIVEVIAGQVWFFNQNFTVMPSVYCVIPLLIICAVVPLVCYKWLTRESLVARLRVE